MNSETEAMNSPQQDLPTLNQPLGDVILNQFGAIGYFAIGELMRITTEEEQIFHRENVTNMDEVEVNLRLPTPCTD